MPTMIPTHTIMLQRPDPKGGKDKHGRDKVLRITPRIGMPFDFTDEEVEHVMSHKDVGLRVPVNEDSPALTAARSTIDDAAKAASIAARSNSGAENDAVITARAGAAAKVTGRKPARDPEVLKENLGQDDDDEL